jgi:hypothetical protein
MMPAVLPDDVIEIEVLNVPLVVDEATDCVGVDDTLESLERHCSAEIFWALSTSLVLHLFSLMHSVMRPSILPWTAGSQEHAKIFSSVPVHPTRGYVF